MCAPEYRWIQLIEQLLNRSALLTASSNCCVTTRITPSSISAKQISAWSTSSRPASRLHNQLRFGCAVRAAPCGLLSAGSAAHPVAIQSETRRLHSPSAPPLAIRPRISFCWPCPRARDQTVSAGSPPRSHQTRAHRGNACGHTPSQIQTAAETNCCLSFCLRCRSITRWITANPSSPGICTSRNTRSG